MEFEKFKSVVEELQAVCYKHKLTLQDELTLFTELQAGLIVDYAGREDVAKTLVEICNAALKDCVETGIAERMTKGNGE